MLAAAVRVDGAVEGQVGRGVAGDDRFRRFATHLGALGLRHFLIPAVVLYQRMAGGKTVVRIVCRATAL